MKNYYDILGVPNDASAQQINDAYKKLALKFHPDRNDNDAYYSTLFKQINDAKQVLTNAEQRAEYDLQLTNYSDAYSIFTQQQQAEEFKKQQRRQHQAKCKSRKKSVSILAASLLLVTITFFLWAEVNQDPTVLGSKNGSKAFQGIIEDTAITRNEPKVSRSRKETPDKKVMTVARENENYFVPNNKKERVFKKEENEKRGRQLSNQELNLILESIKSERSKNNYNTNCITVRKTKVSNIVSDLPITTFLQKNGFVISGRELVSENFKGYRVEFNGVCMKLIIGEL